jgi:hypothetical protein
MRIGMSREAHPRLKQAIAEALKSRDAELWEKHVGNNSGLSVLPPFRGSAILFLALCPAIGNGNRIKCSRMI